MTRALPPAPEPAITVALLREWLLSQRSDESHVGLSRRPWRCPVANCLNGTYGGDWSVDADKHSDWPEDRFNPRAISRFVTAIDHADEARVVTRGEALAVLNTIEPEGTP